jgi:hypothetical protein
MRLEEVVKDRLNGVNEFRRSIQPLRMTLSDAPFLSGTQPAWADFVCFGPFQWARSVSTFELLEADDPVFAWRSRMIALFNYAANQVFIVNQN